MDPFFVWIRTGEQRSVGRMGSLFREPTFFCSDISLMQIRDSGSECCWCEQWDLSRNILEYFYESSSENLVVDFHGNHAWCKVRIAHFSPKQINNVTIMHVTPIHIQVVNSVLECSHEFLKRRSLFVTVCNIGKSLIRLVNMRILHAAFSYLALNSVLSKLPSSRPMFVLM